jgi:hypothetical protein
MSEINNTPEMTTKLNKQINLAIEAASTSFKLAVVLSEIQAMYGQISADSNPLSVWQGWDNEFRSTLNKHLELLEMDHSTSLAAASAATVALRVLHSQKGLPPV